ncbi:polysaccharide deacetylase family protein [Mycolicibacterium sp. HS_4_1]
MGSTKVTLSFDNGPSEVTPTVLDILRQRSIHSTFFVVGEQLLAPGSMSMIERAASEGHWIGNHTMTHSTQFGDDDDPRLPEREIGAAQDLIEPFAHPRKLFRPYGGDGILDERLLSPAAVDYIEANGFTCVLWNCVPHDWDEPVHWVERCVRDVLNRPWSLVVIHDLPTGAMDHLPTLLDRLDSLGIEIVQSFPPDCVPIQSGRRTGSLTGLGV